MAVAASVTCLLALAAAGQVGSRSLLPKADAASAEGQVALTGTITGIGQLKADNVSVLVEPDEETLAAMSPGDSGQLLPVATDAVSIRGNQYTVTLDPNQLPDDYVSDTGIVTLSVTVTDPQAKQYGVTTASVLAPSRAPGHSSWAGPDWVSALANPSDLASQRSARSAGSSSEVPSAELPEPANVRTEQVANPCAFGACSKKPSSVSARTATAEATDAAVTTSAASGYTLLAKRIRLATNATTYPVGRTTAGFTHAEGRSSTYGIAVNSGNGFSASGSKSVETGSSFGFDMKSYARSYRLYTEYGRYQYCNVYGYCHQKWQPIRGMATGVENTSGVTRPSWSRCLNVSAGTFKRSRSGYSDYSFGAAVKFKDILGFDLSGRRAYNSSSWITYKVAGSSKRLCGNDDYPDYAGKVMERYR